MAPFTHVSPDRPTRFSAGGFGVLYVAESFETALFETMHHHALFMVATGQKPGWTSQFREIVLDVDARLHDLRGLSGDNAVLAPDDYRAGQALGASLRALGSDGVVYPSVRHPGGACAGLFYPDCAAGAVQGRHLDYHFDGALVDFYRDSGANQVFKVL
jgi:RES domain-containing protein